MKLSSSSVALTLSALHFAAALPADPESEGNTTASVIVRRSSSPVADFLGSPNYWHWNHWLMAASLIASMHIFSFLVKQTRQFFNGNCITVPILSHNEISNMALSRDVFCIFYTDDGCQFPSSSISMRSPGIDDLSQVYMRNVNDALNSYHCESSMERLSMTGGKRGLCTRHIDLVVF